MTSSTNSLESNGLAERMNRTLVENVRALIKAEILPQKYWGGALQQALYPHNRTVTSFLDMCTPYDIQLGTTPNNSSIKELGCAAYMLHKQNCNTELDNRAEKQLYLGKGMDFMVYSHLERILWSKRYMRHFRKDVARFSNKLKCTSILTPIFQRPTTRSTMHRS